MSEYRTKAIRYLNEAGWTPQGVPMAWRGVHSARTGALVGMYTQEAQDEAPKCGPDVWVVSDWGLDTFMSWDEFTDEQVIDLWLHVVMEGL